MPRETSERLARLRSRRLDLPHAVAVRPEFGKIFRNMATGGAVRYALVSMLEIDPRATRIALEEAAKVKMHLEKGLASLGVRPRFRLQGSVPLNIHTGASDVDLLVIAGDRLCGKSSGDVPGRHPFRTESDDPVDDILSLRAMSEEVLVRRFPDSSVDRKPAKSIGLSGGGLPWKMDIVPAFWDDEITCRVTQETVRRGVGIADRNARRPIGNFPFAYFREIEGKARRTRNGARMSVRLAKNVKHDAEAEIALSSYDIASLIYHCPDDYIMRRDARDLRILSGVERWLRELSGDRSRAVSLMAPDGTREVLNDVSKWNGLVALSNELTALSHEVERELAA